MEVIGFILIGVLVIVAFVVTKIGAKTNMSDEEREKALEAFYSQSSVEAKPGEFWDLLREGFSKDEGASTLEADSDSLVDNIIYSGVEGNKYY